MDAPTMRVDTRAVRSYLHLPRPALPLALWDLHRVLPVGAPVELLVFHGDPGVGPGPDRQRDRVRDESTGSAGGGADRRPFTAWTADELTDVAHGAGFVALASERFDHLLVVRGVRARTLADTVGPGMRLLLVGLNPSLHAADAGFGFAGPGNRFWPALAAAGLHDGPRSPWLLARSRGIGMTDLVKRASRRADEITKAEFATGLARIERLARWLQPEALCIVGLAGWRAAVDRRARTGWQNHDVGGRPVYVMPNPSGLNAHDTVATLASHLATAWAGPAA